ncbi:MAG TPA: hypothetical protein VF177_03775 [Anaerolineae bacterium]
MTDPITASVVIILGKYAIDKGATLAREAGPAAAKKAGELFQTALAYLRRDPAGQVIADRYEQNPERAAALLEDDLNQAVQADAEFAAQLQALLAQYEEAAEAHAAATGSTYTATVKGGGAVAQGPGATAVGERGVYVGGSVSGSVVAGDDNTVTQVGGDQIEVGDISGSSGVAIGRGAEARVQQGVSGQELAQIFDIVYRRIEERPEHSDVDKEDIVAEVQRIEKEAAKKEQANPNRLESWLRNLANMAPDILDVMAASLGGPVSGTTAVLAKIINKVRSERGTEIGD